MRNNVIFYKTLILTIFLFCFAFITKINVNADESDEIILNYSNINSNNIVYNQNKKNFTNKQQLDNLKPNDVPDFPSQDDTKYKQLFDDSFNNVVETEYAIGDDNDIFIDPYTMASYIKEFTNGNDDYITQMDVIMAEKKAQEDGNNIDKNKILQNRYRVVAFLTKDQMLLSDMFKVAPDAYYIDFVKSKLNYKNKIRSFDIV